MIKLHAEITVPPSLLGAARKLFPIGCGVTINVDHRLPANRWHEGPPVEGPAPPEHHTAEPLCKHIMRASDYGRGPS